jgi:hypothetical protein
MTADCFLNGIILSLYHVRTVCEDFNSQAVFVFESKMMGRSSAWRDGFYIDSIRDSPYRMEKARMLLFV